MLVREDNNYKLQHQQFHFQIHVHVFLLLFRQFSAMVQNSPFMQNNVKFTSSSILSHLNPFFFI